MDATKDWIPGGESKMLALCHRWIPILTDEQTVITFKWDMDQVVKVTAKIDVYIGAAGAYAEVDSTSNRKARDDARKEAVTAMRAFANSQLRYNPYMNDGDRSDMGLPTPDTVPTVHPRPTSAPDTVVDGTPYHFQHRVCALNVTGRRRSKPAGVHGIRYVWQVGGERPVNGASMLKSQFSRKTEIIVMHDEADRGKPAFYAACYENARGEAGPWSPVVEMFVG